jgi:hypothetical protein
VPKDNFCVNYRVLPAGNTSRVTAGKRRMHSAATADNKSRSRPDGDAVIQ